MFDYSGDWTPERVEVALVEAVFTLVNVPDPDLKFRECHKSTWPGYRVERWDYPEGYTAKDLRVRPSPEQLDSYLEVLEWFKFIPSLQERKLMSLAMVQMRGVVASKIQWEMPRLKAKVLCYSPRKCKRVYKANLNLIAGVLSQRHR